LASPFLFQSGIIPALFLIDQEFLMQAEQVKQILESQLENCTVKTAGEGCDFQVTVIGELFEGLRPVKCQQLVYACLNEYIANGTIHALTIKTYTPAQWEALQN
jgi:acid stress-induced BolA-like protein IbaG/YrbA